MAKVLVVDDASFMRMTIKQMLEKNGHETIGEAGNGVEAVKKYVELKPEVVLLDITMPEMNGVDALKKIRELDRTARIIICSAIGQQEIIARAIQCGASDFIVKPFEASQLLVAIEKVMRE